MTTASLFNLLCHLPTSTSYTPSIMCQELFTAVIGSCCSWSHVQRPAGPLHREFLYFLRPPLNVITPVSSSRRLQPPSQNILLFLMCLPRSLFFNVLLAKINCGRSHACLSFLPPLSWSAPPGESMSRLPDIQ